MVVPHPNQSCSLSKSLLTQITFGEWAQTSADSVPMAGDRASTEFTNSVGAINALRAGMTFQ